MLQNADYFILNGAVKMTKEQPLKKEFTFYNEEEAVDSFKAAVAAIANDQVDDDVLDLFEASASELFNKYKIYSNQRCEIIESLVSLPVFLEKLKSIEKPTCMINYQIGYMYELGKGTEQNFVKAAEYYTLSANHGYAVAHTNLGYMYESGQGVQQDLVEAAKHYKIAADLGDARGQCSIGCLYINGQGVPQDLAEAAKYYKLAADQGDARGQHAIGYMYHGGQGVLQDLVKAAQYYKLSADQGNVYGQRSIAVMYKYGQGVPQDVAAAAKYCKLAADEGDLLGSEMFALLLSENPENRNILSLNEACQFFNKTLNKLKFDEVDNGVNYKKSINLNFIEYLKKQPKTDELIDMLVNMEHLITPQDATHISHLRPIEAGLTEFYEAGKGKLPKYIRHLLTIPEADFNNCYKFNETMFEFLSHKTDAAAEKQITWFMICNNITTPMFVPSCMDTAKKIQMERRKDVFNAFDILSSWKGIPEKGSNNISDKDNNISDEDYVKKYVKQYANRPHSPAELIAKIAGYAAESSGLPAQFNDNEDVITTINSVRKNLEKPDNDESRKEFFSESPLRNLIDGQKSLLERVKDQKEAGAERVAGK